MHYETFFIEETKDFIDWGTIEDWMDYKFKLSNTKSIVIDVDNTLSVTDPSVPYEKRIPKEDVISKLREYQKLGYYIIIETGRQMKTYHKSVGLINANTLPTLIDWLHRHGVPYDEIHVGKPWQGKNGFRVDDSTIRPSEFLKLTEEEILELVK